MFELSAAADDVIMWLIEFGEMRRFG